MDGRQPVAVMVTVAVAVAVGLAAVVRAELTLPLDGAEWTLRATSTRLPPQPTDGGRRARSMACDFRADTDFEPETPEGHAVASREACCALCQATLACWAAAYSQGRCYLKPYGARPLAKPGVVGCVPGTHQLDEVPAQVPGVVHLDLLRAGLIPDPYYRFGDVELRWIADSSWAYRRTFELPEQFMRRSAIELVADGLDTVADVFINGRHVGNTTNMFHVLRLPIKHAVVPGRNSIEIRFASPSQFAALQAAAYKPQSPGGWGIPPDCPPAAQNGICRTWCRVRPQPRHACAHARRTGRCELHPQGTVQFQLGLGTGLCAERTTQLAWPAAARASDDTTRPATGHLAEPTRARLQQGGSQHGHRGDHADIRRGLVGGIFPGGARGCRGSGDAEDPDQRRA